MADGAETKANTWQVVATDKRARFWSGAVWDAENRGVHVWGGLTGRNDVEVFDPAKDAWVQQYKPDPGSGSMHKQWSYHPTWGWLKSGRPAVHCFVWDQLACDASRKKVYCFLGGQTAAYDVKAKTWKNLRSRTSPPPASWGALAFDPVKKEMLLFGGGGVYEGRPGMWAYSPESNDWRRLKPGKLPPARCCSPLAVDAKNRCLVVFGGDAQDRLLDDTWVFDLEKREWRQSASKLHPSARGGHGLAWEPKSGLVLLARGYTRIIRSGNAGGGRRVGLSNETWAYDVKLDRWRRLKADMPGLIPPKTWPRISETMAAFPGGVVFLHNQTSYGKPVLRKTVVLRLDTGKNPFMGDAAVRAAQAKGEPPAPFSGNKPPEVPAAHKAKTVQRLKSLPANTWVRANPLKETEFNAFGNMHFDYAGERAVYWGGGHSDHQQNHLVFRHV